MKAKDIFLNILFLVIGAILTFIVTKQLSIDNNKLRYFDMKVNQRAFIGKPTNIDKKLEVLLDGKPISNLREVSIELFNLMDVDFGNIPVYIIITDKKGDSLKVIQSEIYGENKSYDKIKDIPKIKPTHKVESKKFGYMISTANRADIDNPFFVASYYLASDSEIDVNLDVDLKGVKVRDFSYLNLYPDRWYQQLWFSLTLFTIVYFFFIWFLIRVLKRINKKKYEKKQKNLISYIEENLNDSLIDTNNKTEMIKEIDFLCDIFYWNNTPLWSKILFSRKEPKKE